MPVTRFLPLLILALLWTRPALSDDPAAQPTVLHLTQAAERRLTRDLLHVDIRAEKTGSDPQAVEATINQNMTKALAQAKQVPGIDIETGAYSVYRDTSQNGWSGSQMLFLSGKDAGALLKLAGALQSDGLVMSNLIYAASPAVVRGVEDELTAEALSALAQRAAAIAQQLHLSVARYRDLTVGNAQTEGGPMPRVAQMAMAASSMPTPVAAAGEATVHVTVTADILLAAKP